MAATKKASPNGTIDFATLSPAVRRYERFTMDAGEGDEGEPLWVKAQRMTPAEVEDIPAGAVKTVDVVIDYQRCFVAWNLTGLTDAGDVKPIPPPAELEPDSLRLVLTRLLTQDQVNWLYQTIKVGDALRMIAEKKALIRSATSPASSPEASSADEA